MRHSMHIFQSTPAQNKNVNLAAPGHGICRTSFVLGNASGHVNGQLVAIKQLAFASLSVHQHLQELQSKTW